MNLPSALTILPPERKWTADWIWGRNTHQSEQARYQFFRKVFSLEEVRGAELLITARVRYRLWVNGRYVADGPPMSGTRGQYVDRHALSGVLRAGENVIAVQVYDHLWGKDEPGLLCELCVGEEVLLKTDNSWKSLEPTCWNRASFKVPMNCYAPRQEHLDARGLPADWQQLAFDDSDWSQAFSVGHPPKGPAFLTFERDIPLLEQTPLYADSIAQTEECLSIMNRQRSEDVSLTLSAVGREPELCRFEGLEHLLSGEEGCRLACSDRHLQDRLFDGEYDPCVLLDFGKVITAYVEFELSASAGAVLEFGYAERLIDGRFNNAIESPFGDKYTCREGHQTYRFLSWRAFRFLKIRLRNCHEGIELHRLQAIRERYPYEEKGDFESTDETLNGIFEICRETIRLCSVDQLMDTPWREAAQWLGDVAAVTLPGIYACFGDTRMPEKFLRQSGMAATDTGLISQINHRGGEEFHGWLIPDYSLWWVMGLWQHYRYTGNAAWIHSFYAECQRVLRYHLHFLDDEGFVSDVPGWVFIDWAALDRKGCSAAYNAIFTGALDALGEMAGLIGDKETQTWSADTATHIRDRFHSRFFEQESGLYADAWHAESRSETISEQTNFAALLFDCAPSGQASEIIRRFYEADTPPQAVESQPFFMVVVLEALRKNGRGDLALQLIRDRWGERMLKKGATSCFEEWTTNGSFREGRWKPVMRTHSHAWSACPAEYLIRQLSGIEILEPGCRRIRVAPQAGDLHYCAKFPTPLGTVTISQDENGFSIEIPEGMEVERRQPACITKT